MGRTIRAAVLALAMAGAAVPAVAQSLADTLVAAYRNSNLLEQNRALLRASDEDVVVAQARLLPVINFISRALTTRSDPTPLQGQLDYRLSFAVSLDMPLIDFGRGRLGVDLAREQVLSARAGLLVVEQRVLLTAIAAHLNLHTARQNVALRRSNIEVVTRQTEAARARVEFREGTLTDVALAEARLAQARSALAAAEGDVAVAREDYTFAVGRAPSGIGAPPALPRLPRTLAEAQAHARAHHPAIQQAQHQVAAADLVRRIAQTERRGTVTGSLSAEARSQRLGIGTSQSTDLTLGLSYQVPLFTGGRLPAAERQAVARAEAQRAALNQTVAQVNAAVGSAWAQLEVARAQTEAARLRVAAAEAALDAVTAEAEFGTRTSLDVLDAEQDLLDARTSRVLAGTAIQRAAYALLEATGQLTVQSLNLGIPVYDVGAYSAGFRRGLLGAPVAVPSRQGSQLDRIRDRWEPAPER